MKSVVLGVGLGVLNTIVIALGIGALTKEPAGALLVMIYGGLPAVVVGAVMGGIAGGMRAAPSWLRWMILAPIALLLVTALGREFGMPELIMAASVPTIAAVFVLERKTRELKPPPAIPVARVS